MSVANAYPELPVLDYEETSVEMADVIAYLQSLAVHPEVKQMAYVMFRNESANGHDGVNNNYAGIQADGDPWPDEYTPLFIGTVLVRENKTGNMRRFVAFESWHGSVDMLVDRVQDRGLYIGGTTHKVTHVAIATELELATAYLQEWVHGSAEYKPNATELQNFQSMYSQTVALFRNGAAPLIGMPDSPPVESDADRLMDAEQERLDKGETA